MSLKVRDRLKHILIESQYLTNLAQRLDDKKDLAANEDLKRSAERSIEIIGEAVKTLPEEIRQLSPHTQWSEIARMRDNIIHRYHDINYNIVWQVIEIYAPSLCQEVTKILNILKKQEYDFYRSQIQIKELSGDNYLLKIDRQKKIDVAIAKMILKEYPTKFRKVAIAQIKDIIGAGEKATELLGNTESTTATEYISQIISALSAEKVYDTKEEH